VTVDALATDETLLILKIAFLVLLYGFILLVVRTATKDLGGAPQESIVLGAAEAAALRARYAKPARFVVLEGPGLPPGSTIEVSAPTVAGRDADSDIGSTNGTFVNGAKVETAQLLRAGDTLRIGQTELRLDA